MSVCPSSHHRFISLVPLFLITLFLSYLISSPTVSANSIYNRAPWPQAYLGLDVVKENTDFVDAAHPCNRTHGRSFSVTHADGFKLVGLSVYVYVPASQNSKFNRNLFHLSFLDSSSKLLVTNTSATYSAPIDLDNGANTTYEVYFPLNININGGASYTSILECLTDEVDAFRVVESSRIGDGLTQYYNSTTSQTYPYYMEGRKVLFTTFSERNAPHFPSLTTPSPIASATGGQAPKFHPVIFVHGLGGDPTNFESDAENRNYVKLLTDLGYPKDYIHLYSYGYKYDPVKKVTYYNYQGDVKEIAQGMEVAVNTLSDLNKSQGGDGKVDIVAHSLGNLVTRQYLLTHKDNHKIRRYIAVGAPFKGAWMAGLDNGVRSFPVLGPIAEKYLSEFAYDAINSVTDRKLDKNSVVYAQLAPSSSYLESLDKTKIDNIEVYALYGDINATIRQKIFNKQFEKKIDFGDGIILSKSASYTSWASNGKTYAFGGNAILDLKYERKGSALAAEVSVTDLSGVKTLHSELLTKPDSKSKIKCILVSDNTSGC